MGTSNNIDYEMTTKHIYIDVWDPMENRVDVVQGEASARYVVAHIHHSGVPLNLEGASVQFYGTKPDGTGILNDCEVLDGKRGIVSIPMTQQMSIAPGEYEEAGLQIIRDGKVLKVLGLSIVVHPAYDYDEYLSEDELTAVQEAIDRSNYAASRIPSIGENGNWYLGEEDTGKPSRGKEGIRGRGLLKVSTAPTEESSTVDGYAYKYKFKLSTVLAESNASEVLVGDVLKYSYYEYGVGYVGASYAFAYTRTSIRGSNGTSVTVSSVSESAADGGSNVVNFSDGKSLTVKNGTQGSPGAPGEDGRTPVKGVDYYTEADKAEFSEYIASELAKRGQLKPEFANSIEECTDTSKLYVLPDGMIYAWMYAEKEVGGYTNMVDPSSSDFNATKRYNASGAITTGGGNTGFVSNMFSVKAGDVLRIKGVSASTSTSATAPIFVAARLKSDGSNFNNAHCMYLRQPLGSTPTTAQQCYSSAVDSGDGIIKWTFAVNNAGQNMATDAVQTGASAVVNTRIAGVATNGFENVIVTVNEEIIEPTIVKEYQWASTGHAFVPANYENRIIALEAEDAEIREEIATAQAETDEAIAGLQEQIDSGAASAKSGARWFALGDSITEGWASAVDTSASSGYKQFLNTNTAQRWVNIVAEKNGYELTNYGVGGTGYAHAKSGTVNARAQVSSIDFSKCDFVTLAYGVNDWKGKATLGSMNDDVDSVDAFVPNMRYVIKKILTDNPYCKIFVITPLNCRSLGDYATNFGINYANSSNASGPGLEDIFQLEKAVCDYHGIELIDMTHSSIVNRENIRTMLADYVHPTVECHAVMARELAQKITFR